jgi:hypothetical protein
MVFLGGVIIKDVDGDDRPFPDRSDQRGLIGKAEVPAEPEERNGVAHFGAPLEEGCLAQSHKGTKKGFMDTDLHNR